MVGLIPVIEDDYLLAILFIIVIALAFKIKKEPKELTILVTGFLFMIFFEAIFISTGVEVFYRNSLLGIMPIWLPILWAYGFVAISRAVKILNR